MEKIILLFFLLLCRENSFSQLTRFEKTNGAETAGYFEVIDFYRGLAKGNGIVTLKEQGHTDAGYPLHTVLVSHDKSFDPKKWHAANKVVIMVNNGIHAGEPDGIDASMMLVRDIKNRKFILPDNVVLAVIPVYNIGGALNRNSTSRVNQNGPAEYGFRGNAQNLDLNRDFTKNDSRESQSFARIFHWLDPDIFIDNHVSDGADFQHTITLITTQYDKLGPVQGKWLREIFEPQIYAGMKEKNRDLIPYVEFDGANFEKGIDMFYETPRYSSGYAALFGCFSFIPETHMLKPYADRVSATYQLMTTFIEKASLNASAIGDQRRRALNAIKTQQHYPLRWSIDRSEHSNIVFKGFEQDTALSEATGLKKMFYNRNRPYTKTIKFFDRYKAEKEIEKPMAYVIPAGWYPVIERLELNGVKVQRLRQDTFINITVYRIEDYKSRSAVYEKHHNNYEVKVSAKAERMQFLKGDFLIKTDQYSNRYIIEMLEPTGDDSFFAWNFFDGVLQRKEGYSNYRWEELAAGVLKNDPILKAGLELKKRSDPAFATNSTAILNFIYRNSTYSEKAFMRYPVYRIEK